MSRRYDIAVIGGGLGGVAAALAAASQGQLTVLVEEGDWLGGQATSQGVPPDEHPWIELFGCAPSYRRWRDGIRSYYATHYALIPGARGARYLNPGAGQVSRLCAEPKVAAHVLRAMTMPLEASGHLTVLLRHKLMGVELAHPDEIREVTVLDARADKQIALAASRFLDATETGDLIALSGTDYVVGAESQSETYEPHAPVVADSTNMQAFSVCYAMDHMAGEDHTIDPPETYAYWKDATFDNWPGPMLSWDAPDPRTLEPYEHFLAPNSDDELPTEQYNRALLGPLKPRHDVDLWRFRRILYRGNFASGTLRSDITLVNWPMIDYWGGPIVDVDEATRARHLAAAKELSMSMLYWMQTEAPRPDGGTGYPGLRLRLDVMDTEDGLAKHPYIRESRRIRGQYTVVEQDVTALEGRQLAAFHDTVGIGYHRLDLHPSTGGDPFFDVESVPFEIPARALLPVRVMNLVAAGKGIATTHISNGCFRTHATEWSIGHAAGCMAAYSIRTGTPTCDVASAIHVKALQDEMERNGAELHWPQPLANASGS